MAVGPEMGEYGAVIGADDDPAIGDPPQSDEISNRLRAIRPRGPGGLERNLGMERVLRAIDGPDAAPVQLGRFTIERKIGQGAMGVVYLAHDPTLGRAVAVKILNHRPSEAAQSDMLVEARALARLSHPHVVAIYDVGQESGSLYVAMEHVEGMTLAQWRSRHPDADWRDAAELCVQAGEGLAAIHRANLVHRDFKPANVLVGNDGRVRVVDFGLATALAVPAESKESIMAGTPSFMAPEVRSGAPPDARSDQYSFCHSMWKIIDPVHALRASDADMPPSVRAALVRGLRADPAQRWPSMDALLVALHNALHGVAIDRQRNVFLDRVERLWLDGIMVKALGKRDPLALPLTDVSELVRRPWEEITQPAILHDADTSQLVTVLEASNDGLLIVGQPGAGKTTALLQLARRLLDSARTDAHQPMPVVLNLSSFGTGEARLDRWIEDELVTKYSMARSRVRSWLESHELLLLLDGLDEIPKHARSRGVREINEFRSLHATPMVVVCREDDYRGLDERLVLGGAVRIEPLDPLGVDALLASLGQSGAGLADSLRSEAVGEEIRTPLMLTVLAISGVTDTGGGKELWRRTYQRYIDRMFERGDGPYTKAAIIHGLGWLARAMQRQGLSELWLERLQATLLPKRSQRVSAVGLGVVLVSLALLSWGFLAGWAAERDTLSSLILGSFSIPAVFVFLGGVRVQPVEALRWSWRRTLRRGPIAILLGLALGIVYGWFFTFWYDVVIGTAGGVVTALIVGLEGSDREARVRPNQGILQSIRNGVVLGAAGTLLAAFVLGLIVGTLAQPLAPPGSIMALDPHPRWTVACLTAGFMGSATFMIMGGAAALLHAAIRIVLALSSPLPLRLVPFLDHAVDRALLRRVGGGYIFVHKTLLEHLAQHEP